MVGPAAADRAVVAESVVLAGLEPEVRQVAEDQLGRPAPRLPLRDTTSTIARSRTFARRSCRI